MRRISVIGLVVFLSGCATYDPLVETVSSPTKGGAVEYFFSLKTDKNKSREVALARAEKHCGGEFDITKEAKRDEGFLHYETVHFSCK